MAKSRTVTAGMREEIFWAACKLREKQLAKEYGSLRDLETQMIAESADAIYDALIPKKEQRMLKRLPAHFVPQTPCIYVEVPIGEDTMARRLQITFKEQRPIPFALHARTPTLPADHPIVKQIQADQRRLREIQEEYRQFQDEVRALLAGVRTLKQLFQRWPEVTKIDGINPELFVENQTTAVVITSDKVSTLLGLKS